MKKLMDAARANPSPANVAKLATYLRKHMMAACLLTPADIAELRSWGVTV